jgi:acyl-CoA thioesterase I
MKKIISLIFVLALLGAVWWLFGTNDASRVPITTPATTGSIRIVAFGDSLTAGYGVPLADSYPSQLETLLRSEGYDVSVINAGVSGETTAGARERAEFIRSQNPAIVLLGIGGNDALRILPVTEAKENIRATIEALQAGEGAPTVVLLGMQAPLNAGFTYKADFDRMYEDIAQEFSIPLAPFIVRGVTLNPKYTIDDGIHLNRAGYRYIIDEYLAPEIRPLLEG